jgi:hypothetical protein
MAIADIMYRDPLRPDDDKSDDLVQAGTLLLLLLLCLDGYYFYYFRVFVPIQFDFGNYLDNCFQRCIPSLELFLKPDLSLKAEIS